MAKQPEIENEVENEEIDAEVAAPNGWEEEQVGFAPYWTPEKGKTFLARVENFDMRDPKFQRFICENKGKAMTCHTGPQDDQKEVTVKKGERFSLSAYAGLPLLDYMGCEVFVEVVGKRKIAGQPNPMWVFTIRVSPETKRMLAERRRRDARSALALRNNSAPATQNGDDEIPF
jgi:hypothetical protein